MIDWFKPLRTRKGHFDAEFLAPDFLHPEPSLRRYTNVVVIAYPQGDELHYYDNNGICSTENATLHVENVLPLAKFAISANDHDHEIEAENAEEALRIYFDRQPNTVTELHIRQL